MQTKETIYNTYLNAQKENHDRIALFTREGEAITHGRLLDEIDRAAEGLLRYKSSEIFKVGIISSCSAQEAVILFAASKIGAVTKFIDFTKNMTEINESINESSISVLALGAEFLPMEPIINPSKLPVIVFGETSNSCPHYIMYKELIEKTSNESCNSVSYKEKTCTVIINSSGTTGTPKPIELSDYAINVAVLKMLKTDYPLNENNLLLKTIPSHIGMGLITTLYTGLIVGIPVVYINSNGPKESIESALKFLNEYFSFLKKNSLSVDTKLLIFSFPMYFRTLFQFKDIISDLSFVKCMLAGGSGMSKEELEIMDAAFAEKQCTVPILNGYGQNEMAGAVTLNQISMNRRGSAGILVNETELLITDLKSGEPVPNNTIGKILERSESLFIRYENMEEATKESFVTDSNGLLWFDTNDVGYIDEDGYLFITGRTSRVIIRYDCKMSLDSIEKKLRQSSYIKDVGVIAPKINGEDVLLAYVCLDDNCIGENIGVEDIMKQIQSSANPLNELEMINKIIIRDSIPYRSSGKIDYRALEKEAEMQYIN